MHPLHIKKRVSHLGALLLQVLDGGHRGTDTGVVRDLLAVKGHVQVHTDEHALALEVGLAQAAHGLLGHGHHVGAGAAGLGLESTAGDEGC
jgi:hypothetical protein